MAVHLLNDFSYGMDDVRCAYVTQSAELLTKVKADYKALAEDTVGSNIHYLKLKRRIS